MNHSHESVIFDFGTVVEITNINYLLYIIYIFYIYIRSYGYYICFCLLELTSFIQILIKKCSLQILNK